MRMMKFLLKKRRRNFWKTKAGRENASVGIMISDGKVEEMDEIVMAEIQKSQGEYKPLAKVEELEEANYNMIDNVLNNMPPKKRALFGIFCHRIATSSTIWAIMKRVLMLIR